MMSARKAHATGVTRRFLTPPFSKPYMLLIPPPIRHYVQQMRIFAGKHVP
jgi:hypothetical protein